MKHNKSYTLKNLSLEQFNAKFKTVQSLCAKNGQFNSTILRYQMSNFLASNIYQLIIDKTKCLNEFGDISIFARFAYLVGNIKIQKCNKCGKPYLYVKNEQKTFKSCNHKFRYDDSSIRKSKRSRLNNRQHFIDSVSNTTLCLNENDFMQCLSIYASKPDNYAYNFSQNPKFFHDVIIKTFDVIPFNEKKFHLGKRIYCAQNHIFSKDDIPRCKYCGKPTYIINRLLGFADSCKECSKLLANDTRAKKNKELLNNIIDKSKYEIIQYPKLFSYEPVKIRCKKCGYVSTHWFVCGIKTRFENALLCQNCELKDASIEEREVFSYVESLVKEPCYRDDRKAISPKELDIYVPNLKKAIEYNGLHWHSFGKGEDGPKYRHRDKMLQCIKNGIQLFNLFSDDWIMKNDVAKKTICKFITPVLCSSNDVMNVKSINYVQAEAFHTNENLFGSVKSSINYGAYVENKLVGVMSIRESIYNQHVQYELTRFSYCKDMYAIDVFKILFNAFSKDYGSNLKSIVWYCKLDLPIDRSIAKYFGFKLYRTLKPDYTYMTDKSHHRINKSEFTKDKLKAKLKSYDPFKSSIENMEANGFRRVFDCGKEVWIKEFN